MVSLEHSVLISFLWEPLAIIQFSFSNLLVQHSGPISVAFMILWRSIQLHVHVYAYAILRHSDLWNLKFLHMDLLNFEWYVTWWRGGVVCISSSFHMLYTHSQFVIFLFMLNALRKCALKIKPMFIPCPVSDQLLDFQLSQIHWSDSGLFSSILVDHGTGDNPDFWWRSIWIPIVWWRWRSSAHC